MYNVVCRLLFSCCRHHNNVHTYGLYFSGQAFIENCKLRDVKKVAEDIMDVYDMETTAFTTDS